MTVFFVSDTHFGHSNIIKFCKRPYTNVDEMNADLVQRWNAVVGPEDDVWHLGDFSFGNYEDIFFRLNGNKHLIIGNHDHSKVKRLPWASSPTMYHELRIKDGEGIQRDIVLFHYPIEEWDGFYKGKMHFHGHVHGRELQPCDKVRVDVAVDVAAFNFSPVTLDQILAYVSTGSTSST